MRFAALRPALLAVGASVFALFCAPLVASADQPIALTVDASLAPTQNVVKTHEVIPVTPGPLTLFYPEWIPGEHAASGPIANVAGLVITGGGQTIAWRRDPGDMFAVKLDVPKGVSSIDVNFVYLGATYGEYSSNRLATPNILVIDWNQNILYPSTGTMFGTHFDPTLILPGSNWKFATALYDPKRSGNSVSFSTTSLERLLDSPLDSCTNFRQWVLWQGPSDAPGTATLNVCADTPEELAASPKVIDHYKELVKQMIAMYGVRHWHDYHFLLTLSDIMPGEGVEHHESSDDGEGGDYLINPMALRRGADLLSHEFNHSWDGKWRMPIGLARDNPNIAFDDSLLWVYEGMTQYYGGVMAYRDGILPAKGFPDQIAAIYASYDHRPGRMWRSLGDTATAAPFLYGAPFGYNSERRGVDFYAEGALMWLRVDSIIRAKTNNAKSLDDFARAFFGGGKNTGPDIVPYDRQDVIDGLNKIVPYDWAGFFHKWVDDIAPHPPNGFTPEGWKLVYTAQPTIEVPKTNFAYSLGFSVASGGGFGRFGGQPGEIFDVQFGSPAYNAGVGIRQRIVAVNGRAFSGDVLYGAVVAAQKTHRPITLLLEKGAMFRTVSIPYYGGPKYPHLVRIAGTPNWLMDVVKPRT